MRKTTLILIRHGQTKFNLQKRYCGDIDAPLNNEGKRQVRMLAQHLKKEKVYKVFSSDKKRALQTARIAFKNVDICPVSELREMHFGIFEGLTHDEILKKYPRPYQKWLNDPFSSSIPKGEHLKHFRIRVVRAIRKLIKENPNKTIAVVCHGGAISVFLTHLLKTKNFWEFLPKSTALTRIDFINGKAIIEAFNDVRHLDE
ncbi:MAG TPA: histidine phosphatase family protein [Candidatus Omnitrophota bacterium]|mgnify:CR=1 FL=1|nr:histidine phosphatase family protein [Candidatus Omnitrophota bacterium]HPT07580.1 histidine phosphatase family protein [Candidatus Omnitrophota bacterium]